MLYILNLPGGSKYKIYNMTTNLYILYLRPLGKFKIYNMTERLYKYMYERPYLILHVFLCNALTMQKS